LENLLEEIKGTLRSLRGEGGEELIGKIFEKKEIYRGPPPLWLRIWSVSLKTAMI